MAKYVQYTITVVVDEEEPLSDWDLDTQDEDSIREYISQERWDYLRDGYAEWDIHVRIVERDEP